MNDAQYGQIVVVRPIRTPQLQAFILCVVCRTFSRPQGSTAYSGAMEGYWPTQPEEGAGLPDQLRQWFSVLKKRWTDVIGAYSIHCNLWAIENGTFGLAKAVVRGCK